MTPAATLTAAGSAIGALCLVLALAIAVRRGLRGVLHRRTERLVEPYRRLLVQLVGDDPTPARRVPSQPLRTLLALDRRTWRALEPVVVAMVRKLRGESRAVLVEVLRRQGTVARHTRQLARHGAVGRARSAELLGLLGEYAPREQLERRLAQDRVPEVRIVVARALGEIGNPASAPALLAASVGPRAVPLRIVARSLARLGPGAGAALVLALRHPEPTVRSIAAEILGLGGTVTAVGVLANHLRHDPDDDVRIRSARALGRIGVPSGIAPLSRCLAVPEPVGLRAVAARAIGDIGGPEAIRLLTALLDDESHLVASNAGRALGGLGPHAIRRLREVAAAGGPGARYAAEAIAVHEMTSTVSPPRGAPPMDVRPPIRSVRS